MLWSIFARAMTAINGFFLAAFTMAALKPNGLTIPAHSVPEDATTAAVVTILFCAANFVLAYRFVLAGTDRL